jgi:hypothetical protein
MASGDPISNSSDLYGLALDRFVPERAALVKSLRAEGRREEAAAVAKLAKPSLAAWAVNQLVRTQRRAVAALFEAGDALQQAQADVVSGQGSAQEMRSAAERERAAVAELATAARGLLSSEGQSLSPATLERVSDTLHAAALEADARAAVRDGCLSRELRHVGLGGLGTPPAGQTPARTRATGPAGRSGKAPRKATASAEQRTEREAARRAEAEQARDRARRLAAARQAQREAQAAGERAVRELERARTRRDELAAALDEAEATVAAAEAQAAEAEQALRRTREAIEQL